ncbi:hypothetical protein WN55_07189 [Dufourea novaeangliae]|uniref:DUF4817 domain-containing protein n=1 Tax=Dufourea novaeangliae TaxID=178035 RepID=A0A154PS10_DUFNO|nr:hypothetical protein WN55_07189 [Dufourea novaeangliae]
MLLISGECQQNSVKTKNYAERYPHRSQPSCRTCKNVCDKLRRTGSLTVRKSERGKRVTNEENEIGVLASVATNPRISSRQIERASGISRILHRILHLHKFHKREAESWESGRSGETAKRNENVGRKNLGERSSSGGSFCRILGNGIVAEELNTLVGNAFRMAYVAQLQRQPILQDVISPQSSPPYRKDKQETRSSWNKSLVGDSSIAGVGGGCRNSSSNSWLKSRTSPTSRTGSGSSTADMNVQLGSAGSPTLRLASVKTPNSIPGLRPTHNFTNVLGPITNEDEPKSISQQSTPSSDESNSPTELNSYKRLTDKPPLIKRLAMGLTGGRDVLGLNGEDDSCPLVSGSSTPTSPSNRPHSGGYINETIIDSEGTRPTYNKIPPSESLDNTINASITAKNYNIENNRIGHNFPSSGTETEFKSKRRSQISTSSSSVPADGSTHGSTPTPPPLPERTDSLNNRCEEAELRKAPWFQAGIPRYLFVCFFPIDSYWHFPL